METTVQIKTPLELLSKEEIITKYKGLLTLAKKAKLAKDELTEENSKLKQSLCALERTHEVSQRTLEAMQEIITEFTENKLQLTNQITELKKQRETDMEALENLSIENESIKRQLKRFSEDNETLLVNLEQMEKELQQVNEIGQEQKCDLNLLEEQINKLKNVERINEQLLHDNKETSKAYENLKEKYNYIKEINAEQKEKFNSLKERFIDVHRKLKKLKDCKKILLETQHEYAESISQWQEQIIKASKLLCREFDNLKIENAQLISIQHTVPATTTTYQHNHDNGYFIKKINGLINLAEKAFKEQKQLHNYGQKEWAELFVNKLSEIVQLSHEALEEQKQYKNENNVLKNFLQNPQTNVKIINKIHSIISLYDKAIKKENKETLRTDVEIKDISNAECRELEYHTNLQQNIEQQPMLQCKFKLNDDKQKQEEQKSELIQLMSMGFDSNDDHLENENENLNNELKYKNDVLLQQGEQQVEYSKFLQNIQETMSNEANVTECIILEKENQLKDLRVEMENINKKLKYYEQSYTIEVEKVEALNKELEMFRKSKNYHVVEVLNNNDNDGNDHNDNDGLKTKLEKLTVVNLKLEEQLKTKLAELANLEKQYKEQQKSMEALKSENQKLHSSRKQSSVLNLEIEAAERSLKDVANKLNTRNEELNELKDVLKTRESNNKQLRQEIELLEAAKEAESKRSIELKTQIDQLQQTLKDVVHAKQIAYDNSKSLQMEIDHLNTELERVQLQLANSTAEYEKMIDNLKVTNHKSNQQLNHTQEKLHTVEQKLKSTERNNEDLRNEFLDYKVKAQTVLKNQHQTRDLSKEKELEEELFLVKRSEEQYKRIIETLNNKLEAMEQQVKLLQNENENIQKHNKQLLINNEELRSRNDSLAQEIQKHLQQQHETLKQHRLQLNTLDEYHKEQLQTLQQIHEKQLEQLLSKTQDSQNNGKCLSLHKGKQQEDSKVAIKSGLLMLANREMHEVQNNTDFILMKREDAEGSEEGEENRSTQSSSHEFMPLDELLNAPINAIQAERLITVSAMGSNNNNNNNSLIATTGFDKDKIHILYMELNATRDRLRKEESKIRHLTTLLAENEQDLAKLSQLNDMLKEELRRQERSIEREQHMHNSEYLKNVLIKFLTLSQGDEKLRLIPVLNTILKLSRSETEVLNCVAKGQKVNIDLNQRITSSTSGSWSNFLTSWTNNNNHT